MLKASLALQQNRKQLVQAKLVFYFFIASLAMFFAAMLISYCVIRMQAFQQINRDYLALQIPFSFWISTLFLVVTSAFLQGAVWMVRRQRMEGFRKCLKAALWSCMLFIATQIFGMHSLLAVHFTQIDGSTKLYGLCFTLSVVHALHVIGGLAYIVYVLIQSNRGKYDHERHWAVDHCAGYWHFLDVVWMAMLVTFVLAR
ncbi:MAG TPA: cytochrome c oxidase subunit 3 [Pirellulaceae bacterium]|nr:cytochrome c oxidase subunit 3 [Pirellulaceae bacterium]HMO92259.1 cytochrome c oxidase subunit 3 [Pirellulaceae bacterium]HMP70075.1 cytochrome c oxidase subunit 3 [Pirellulaceae bacterium]